MVRDKIQGFGKNGVKFLRASLPKTIDQYVDNEELLKDQNPVEWMRERRGELSEREDYAARMEQLMTSWLESTGDGPVANQQIIGPYITDLYVRKKSLIIEIDGSHHSSDDKQVRSDAIRDLWFGNLGFNVIRIPNILVTREAPGLASFIHEAFPNVKNGLDPLTFHKLPKKKQGDAWDGFSSFNQKIGENPSYLVLASYLPRQLVVNSLDSIFKPPPGIRPALQTPRQKVAKVEKDPSKISETLLAAIEESEVKSVFRGNGDGDLESACLSFVRGMMVSWLKKDDIEIGSEECVRSILHLASGSGNASLAARCIIKAATKNRGEVMGLFTEEFIQILRASK